MKKYLLIPIILLLTGCYNYREINDLAIVSGLSITTNNNNIKLTAEVINIKKEQDASSSEEPAYIIYKSEAPSLQQAITKMINESPKKMYLAQLEILIIDEKIAKNNLQDILDFFARDPESRSEFKVLIGKSDDILEITTPLEKISSENILDSLTTNNNYLGTSSLITYHEFISNILNPNIELCIPVISEKGNTTKGEEKENISKTENDASSIINNMSIFKNNKLIGYLTEEESLTYNIINNNTKKYFIITNYQNNQFIIHKILNSKTNIEYNQNNNEIIITIKGKSSLAEVNYNTNLENLENISKLQKDLNKEIKTLIKRNIKNIIKEYNSDIFGFKDYIYKSNPKYFKKIKNTYYQETFPNLKITIKSNIQGIEKGNLNGGIYYE